MIKNTILSLFLVLGSMTLTAQEKDSTKEGRDGTNYKDKPIVTNVTNTIFMLKGMGGNIAVQDGIDGVLMIDTQFERISKFIEDIVERETEKKVEFIINTHHHGDHVGGNKNFSREGATIIAHKNVRNLMTNALIEKEGLALRKKLEEDINAAEKQQKGSGKVEQLKQTIATRMEQQMEKIEMDHEALPAISFDNDLLFHYNDEDIQLIYTPNAHTNGDILVYFPKSNVMHTGDAFVNMLYPFIDAENGGSYTGYLNGLKRIENLANKETKIIPGHGELASISNVQELSRVLELYYTRIKTAFLQNKTEDQVAAMRDFTKIYDDKGYGDGFITTEAFLRSIYKEVEKNEGAYKRRNDAKQKKYEESQKKAGN